MPCTADDIRVTFTDEFDEVHLMRQPADDYLQVDGPGLPRMMSGITVSIKAGTGAFNNLTASLHRLPFPVDLTHLRRAPKHRRHARGGLRPMVAACVRKLVVHGTQFSSNNAGAPWIVEMQVTKRPSC